MRQVGTEECYMEWIPTKRMVERTKMSSIVDDEAVIFTRQTNGSSAIHLVGIR